MPNFRLRGSTRVFHSLGFTYLKTCSNRIVPFYWICVVVFSHMTLSDGAGNAVVVTPPVTPPDQWLEAAPSSKPDNMQYSPNTAMNGYGPYSNPVTPEVVPIPAELSPDKLPIEELKVLLRRQLEYYFSRYVSSLFQFLFCHN